MLRRDSMQSPNRMESARLTCLEFQTKWLEFHTRMIHFTRRLGLDPHANGAQTSSALGCPDILELETGDFAVIGVDATEQCSGRLAFGASCGPDERVVIIPRRTLVLAKADIPDRA